MKLPRWLADPEQDAYLSSVDDELCSQGEERYSLALFILFYTALVIALSFIAWKVLIS